MKINLKKLTQDKEVLRVIQRTLADQSATKPLAGKLKSIIYLIEEIERDVEIGGESIIELDKPRLEAIEERNKMLKFMNQADDL